MSGNDFETALDAETIADLRARGGALDFDETLALALALARVTATDED